MPCLRQTSTTVDPASASRSTRRISSYVCPRSPIPTSSSSPSRQPRRPRTRNVLGHGYYATDQCGHCCRGFLRSSLVLGWILQQPIARQLTASITRLLWSAHLRARRPSARRMFPHELERTPRNDGRLSMAQLFDRGGSAHLRAFGFVG